VNLVSIKHRALVARWYGAGASVVSHLGNVQWFVLLLEKEKKTDEQERKTHIVRRTRKSKTTEAKDCSRKYM
jgi:hypothetical protein